MLQCLADLPVAELQAFVPELLSQLYIEALCHGNLLEEEGFNISHIFRRNFSVPEIPPDMRHGEHILCLPSGANIIKDVRVKNKLETNSVVELYYQIERENVGYSIKLKGFSDLFDEIVQEPLFNQLRTKEQLAYSRVQSTYDISYLWIFFCVQSSKYDPPYLLDWIDNFIGGVKELPEAIDDASFKSYKSGLIARLLEKDPSLTYETNRFWNQMVDKRYLFDLAEKGARILGNVKKCDLIEWYSTYFQKVSPSCRRFAIRIWGCNTKLEEAEAQRSSVQVINDVTTFKASSEFYPAFVE